MLTPHISIRYIHGILAFSYAIKKTDLMKQDNTETIKQNLKRHHLFSELSDSQLDQVSQFSQMQKLVDGQRLFTQADKVTSFYMVISGKIKLFRMSPDGQEKIIEIVKAGEVFAEALMFTNQIGYPVSSAALAETIVISINANNFQEMLRGSTATCLLMLGSMSFQLRKLIKEIDTITLHSGTCRVASYLIQEMSEDKNNFTLDTPKNVIAARLSVKPETFSRIIKNLKNQDILTIEGNSVTVHNIDALKELSII